MSKGSGGGGYNSRVHVESKSYHLGMGARKQIVAGVAQLGQAQGSHITGHGARASDTGYHGVPRDAGPFPMNSVGADKFGNEWATNVKCGVGGGATVYKAGTQSTQGPVVYGEPMPVKGKILPR
jgi:hypothetical protein